MSTTYPEVLGGTGTIAELYTFAASETKTLKIDIGAVTASTTSINVMIRNLTKDAELEVLNLTGLTDVEKVFSTTLEITADAGDVIGLVTTQSTSGWTWTTAMASPSITSTHCRASGDTVVVSDGSSLEYYQGNGWLPVANTPVGLVADGVGVDLTTKNFYVLDRTANKLYLATHDGVWTDITNGQDVSQMTHVTGNNETRIVLGGIGGVTAAYDGSSWLEFTGDTRDFVGLDMAQDGSAWGYHAKGIYQVLRPTGTSWIGSYSYGSDQPWAAFGTVQTSGFSGKDQYIMDNVAGNAIHSKNNIRLGNNNPANITYNINYAEVSCGYFLNDVEHVIENNVHKRLLQGTPISFQNLAVTTIEPSDGPHLYYGLRETILRPDSGPHVYNMMRETVLFSDDKLKIHGLSMDSLLAPRPTVKLQKHTAAVVVNNRIDPPAARLQKHTAAIVVSKRDPFATIQKQSISVVIAPPPPEAKVQKQSISVVVQEKPPTVHVSHLISETVIRPDPGPFMDHIVSEAVLKPDPGPFIDHLVSETILKKSAGPNILKQSAYAILKPKSGPNILKQSAYAVLKPKTGPNILKQSAYAVLKPKVSNTVHKTSTSVLLRPKVTTVLHKASISVLVRTIPLKKKRRIVSQQVVEVKSL